MEKPYRFTSAQRLTSMINQDNGTAYQLGVDFNLSPPYTFSDEAGRNTRVTVVPLPASHYVTPQDVFYKRLSLSVLGNLPDGWLKSVVVDTVPFSIHQILPQINEALGLDLVEEEVEDSTYFTLENNYRLDAVEAVSLGWLGNYSFKARRTSDGVPLGEVVINRVLNGLDYVSPAV